MQPLVESEPLLALWKVQKDGGNHLSIAKQMKASIMRASFWGRSSRPFAMPCPDQLVFYSSFNTATTMGTLLPLIQQYAGMKRRSFFLFNTHTDTASTVKAMCDVSYCSAWTAALPFSAKIRSFHRANRLAAMLQRLFKKEYDEDMRTFLLQAALMEEAASRFLKNARALVIETDYFPMAKGLVLGAHHNSIPVIEIQHGLFGPHQFPVDCDALLCWGEYFKASAIAAGVFSSRAYSAGCPRFDSILQLRNEPLDPSILGMIKRIPNRPGILLISNTQVAHIHSDIYSKYLACVGALASTDLNVSLRMHPSERNLDHYHRALPDDLFQRITIIPPDMPLYDAIRHCDAVLNVSSSASLEAMLFEKPVLFVDPETGYKLVDYPEHGGGAWTKSETVVKDVDDYCRTGDARNRLLAAQRTFSEQAFANFGHASECVTMMIDKIIAK